MADRGTPLRRSRAAIRALLIACAVMWLLGALPRLGQWYSAQPYYRAQAHALLDGRLALSHSPDGLALDLAWVDGGVQQVWGLGVPLWLALWEAIGRAIHVVPFPDRIAMLIGAALMIYALLRAWLGPGGDRSVGSRGAFLFTALLPGVITMLRGRVGVYEEAEAYAYGAAMLVLAGVMAMIRRPSTPRYVALLAFAGATGLVRPTVWFYGAATAVVATALYVRHRGSLRRALGPVALAASLFAVGGGALYGSNALRFGRGREFGHRLNLEDMPSNLYATRFDYPFARAPWGVAARELLGGIFGHPETAEHRERFDQKIHFGQADLPRFREYYFTAYTWPYGLIVVGGLAGCAIAWVRARREAAGGAREPGRGRARDGARDGVRDDGPDLDREARWLGAWAVLGGVPLVLFYLHSPSLASRYLLDFAPAVAALMAIAWRYAAAGLSRLGLSWIAFAGLVVWWLVSALGFSIHRAYLPPVSWTAAYASMMDVVSPVSRGRLIPDGAYDIADPWLALYLDDSPWWCRCFVDPERASACDHRDLPPGTDAELLRASQPRVIERRIDGQSDPAADLGDAILDRCTPVPGGSDAGSRAVPDRCSIDPAPGDPAPGDPSLGPRVEARLAPPVLYSNGTHWDLLSGEVGVATALFADDPAFVEVELARRDREPIGPAPAVRARVALEELPVVSVASTPRGVRVRFAAPTTPRYRHGLQVIFLAFGPPERLGHPVSEYTLLRVAWRDPRRGEP